MADNIFEIPIDIIFPDELNRYLRERIANYAHENAMLRKNLHESEQKCIQMEKDSEDIKKKLKQDENHILPSFLSSSQTINSKIVELSKNFRDKCVELEKVKTKYSKLLHQLDELKQNENEKIKQPEEPPKLNPDNKMLSEMKQLQEKLNTTTNKMLEYKNLNIQMKNELKQVKKQLQQEVGEHHKSLQSSTWKGRAQIICDLQDKNRKLKETLKNIQEHGVVSDISNNSEKISTKISILENENMDLKSQIGKQKNRIESLKSRCGMLETEHQELKLKIENAKDENAKNKELIEISSKQLIEAEITRRDALKVKDLEIDKLNTEIQNCLSQIENYKALLDNLKPKSGNFSQETQTLKEEQTDAKEDKLSIETLEDEKLKLLEVIDLHKKRLESERNDREKYQQLLRLEKQRSIKLEAAFAKSELEFAQTSRSRYSNISQSSRASENILRNQLEVAEENIKTLQTRLELEQCERKQDYREFAKILAMSKR